MLAEREGIRLTTDAVQLVAELAHGSLRDPVGLLDQLSNYQSETGSVDSEITAEDVRDLVGLTGSDVAISVLRAIADEDAAAALTVINVAIEYGQDPRQLNRQIVGLIRTGLYAASGVASAGSDESIAGLAESLTLNGLLRIAAVFADTEANIRSAVIPQLPLEIAVLEAILGRGTLARVRDVDEQIAGRDESDRMAEGHTASRSADARRSEPAPVRQERPRPELTEAAINIPAQPNTRLADRIKSRDAERVLHDAPIEPVPSAPTSPPDDLPWPETAATEGGSGQILTLDIVMDLWPKIRADIKSLDRRTEALLMETDPVEVTDTILTLASPYEFHRNMLNDSERKSILESVIARRTGRDYRISCVLRSDFVESRKPVSVVATVSMEATAAESVDPASGTGATEIDENGEKLSGAVVRMFDGEIREMPDE